MSTLCIFHVFRVLVEAAGDCGATVVEDKTSSKLIISQKRKDPSVRPDALATKNSFFGESVGQGMAE